MPRKSTTVYPDNWKRIAQQVKDAAQWTCVRCNHKHDPKAGYCLTVHHLDLSPANCEWWNLAPLCQRCHLHIQSKVVMERVWAFEHSEWFKPYVAGYYAAQHGLPTDRAWVEARQDALIRLGQGQAARDEVLAC
ncbi:MAG TPA: HNH endonuclease signature motif containing protein, partial [Roseiflexaceae bacterium]|nr:HNH endonuclease signature motif containing protein [Roseiflexaceae bacterium]